MRVPGTTIRRTMIAVGILVVVVLGGVETVRLRRWSAYYRERADQCAGMAAFWGSGGIGTLQNGKRFAEEPGLTPEQSVKVLSEWTARAEAEIKIGTRFAELKQAYLRAASHPWENGPPDPFLDPGVPAHEWP